MLPCKQTICRVFKITGPIWAFFYQNYEILLHAMTFACLYVALFRKAHGIDVALIFSALAISIMFFASWYNNKKNAEHPRIFSNGTRVFNFLPIAIFEDILLAFAVGISIHYIQYLAISWNVLRKGFGFSLIPIAILIFYSVASTGTLSGLLTQERISLIVFIPTLLQLLHFYYDGLIWRRDDKLVADAMKKALITKFISEKLKDLNLFD